MHELIAEPLSFASTLLVAGIVLQSLLNEVALRRAKRLKEKAEPKAQEAKT